MSMALSPRATELVEQAKVLLADGGYNGFSYADLSKRVNIGKASIHHHFPSKSDLVYTVVRLHREQTLAGLGALQRQFDTPEAQLTAYTEYWAECIAKNAPAICICGMLAAELPILPQVIADEVQRYFDDLTSWVTMVLEHGAKETRFYLRDNAVVEAQTFVSTVYGAMLTARALNKPDVFRETTTILVKRLMA